MTNRDVKELNVQLPNLIEYLTQQQVKNFKLFYGLNANFDRLEKENEKIEKAVKLQLPELFEIENKAIELGKAENEKIQKENEVLPEGEKKKLLTLADAMKLLTEDEQKKHSELMKEYDKILDEKSEFEVYKLKLEDIEDIKVDFWAVRLLTKFMYE